FKDIKPVAFGGAVIDDEPAPAAEAAVDVQPEPIVEPEQVIEPEPYATVEIEHAPAPAFEPLTYPLDDEPVIDFEPEPVMATFEETPVAKEPVVEEPKPKK